MAVEAKAAVADPAAAKINGQVIPPRVVSIDIPHTPPERKLAKSALHLKRGVCVMMDSKLALHLNGNRIDDPYLT